MAYSLKRSNMMLERLQKLRNFGSAWNISGIAMDHFKKARVQQDRDSRFLNDEGQIKLSRGLNKKLEYSETLHAIKNTGYQKNKSAGSLDFAMADKLSDQELHREINTPAIESIHAEEANHHGEGFFQAQNDFSALSNGFLLRNELRNLDAIRLDTENKLGANDVINIRGSILEHVSKDRVRLNTDPLTFWHKGAKRTGQNFLQSRTSNLANGVGFSEKNFEIGGENSLDLFANQYQKNKNLQKLNQNKPVDYDKYYDDGQHNSAKAIEKKDLRREFFTDAQRIILPGKKNDHEYSGQTRQFIDFAEQSYGLNNVFAGASEQNAKIQTLQTKGSLGEKLYAVQVLKERTNAMLNTKTQLNPRHIGFSALAPSSTTQKIQEIQLNKIYTPISDQHYIGVQKNEEQNDSYRTEIIKEVLPSTGASTQIDNNIGVGNSIEEITRSIADALLWAMEGQG